MNRTSIEWTDYSSNPIRFRHRETGKVVHGCVRVSPGCKACYAAAISRRFHGIDFTVGDMAQLEPFVDDAEIHRLLTSRKIAGKRVFVGDMTDVFGEWVTDEMLDRHFAAMALRPDVTFHVLTKRPERMLRYLGDPGPSFGVCPSPERTLAILQAMTPLIASAVPRRITKHLSERRDLLPLPNVHLGVSVEDQARADERIPLLLGTPAAVRFLSVEPMLGAIRFGSIPRPDGRHTLDALSTHGTEPIVRGENLPRIDWCIVGGESGPRSRPCDVAWIRSAVEQCKAAKVPCFVKQLGARPAEHCDHCNGGTSTNLCHMLGGRDGHGHDGLLPMGLRNRKGGDPSEWPPDLRVREFPRAAGEVGRG